MAASAAKLNVLRTSGSGVRSVASQKLDGMEVYFESSFNINVGRGQPAEFGGTRLKQRQYDGNKHHQKTSAPHRLRAQSQRLQEPHCLCIDTHNLLLETSAVNRTHDMVHGL